LGLEFEQVTSELFNPLLFAGIKENGRPENKDSKEKNRPTERREDLLEIPGERKEKSSDGRWKALK
jgi:hypothetical protein